MDGCGKCVCINGGAQCDITKCQEIAQKETKSVPFVSNKSNSTCNDFVNIKNQIAKEYYAEYDQKRLKIITDMLGCKSVDCPQLLAVTNINYNILDVAEKRYIGRDNRINKVVIQSTDTEVENNSPSKQIIRSISYFLNCIQSLQVTITKTAQIYSEKVINLLIFKLKSSFTFTNKVEETRSETNETTIFFPTQNITVGPMMKMNVTFNFFQYDDINNYSVDFEFAGNSTISHPEVGDDSNIIFVKKPMDNFLQNHIDFLSTIEYENDNMIRIEAQENKFILRNFPTSEQITGYGVDVVFGSTMSLSEQ